MKKLLTLALALSSFAAVAQKSDNVGIGTKNPDPSAILDLSSTNKGLLLPRMTQAQRDAIKNPVAGLIVYQVDQTIGVYTYDGTTWQPSGAREAGALVAGQWDKQGNAIDGTDFLGTTNSFALKFKVNNVNAGRIDPQFNVFLGQFSGNNTSSGQYNVGIGLAALSNNTAGTSNLAIGSAALEMNNANNNLAIGNNALKKNTTGEYNAAIGSLAMQENIAGSYNLAFGAGALYGNTGGFNNVAIGSDALKLSAGSNNLAFGTKAGENAGGSGNLFLGNFAGQNENAGSDFLYISNTNSANPLIKGKFSNTAPWVRVNVKPTPGSPTPATTGYLAIGDFDTAPGGAGAGGLGLPGSFSGGPYRLYVQDGIMTEKLKVALRNSSDWADYVFAPNYQLMPLEQVESFIKTHKHLPNVPSADEMASNGIDVTKTSAKLMEKIEELTLYVIELQKEIKLLKEKK